MHIGTKCPEGLSEIAVNRWAEPKGVTAGIVGLSSRPQAATSALVPANLITPPAGRGVASSPPDSAGLDNAPDRHCAAQLGEDAWDLA